MKLPFSFGTRLVFRLVLPGLVLSLVLFPLIRYGQARFAKDVPISLILPFTVTFLGWCISLLDMPIYQVWEGRRYWPDRLRRCLLRRQAARLKRLQDAVGTNRGLGNEQRANELEILTTDFPLTSDGVREARFPTRLGNIITEFEEYPTRKYEADGVFYWPRIWWKLPKEVRDSLDDMQAMVDGALYVSTTLCMAAPLCLAYAIVDRFIDPNFIIGATALIMVLLAPAAIISGYLLYRASIFAHSQFGEHVKAMFDCFLKEVDVAPVIDVIARKTGEYRVRSEPPSTAYRIAWRYLRWHRFRPYGESDNVNIESYRGRFYGSS